MRFFRREQKHDARFERVLTSWGEPSGIYQAICCCGFKGRMYLTAAEAELEAMEHDPLWRTLPGYAVTRAKLRLLIVDQRARAYARFQ